MTFWWFDPSSRSKRALLTRYGSTQRLWAVLRFVCTIAATSYWVNMAATNGYCTLTISFSPWHFHCVSWCALLVQATSKRKMAGTGCWCWSNLKLGRYVPRVKCSGPLGPGTATSATNVSIASTTTVPGSITASAAKTTSTFTHSSWLKVCFCLQHWSPPFAT